MIVVGALTVTGALFAILVAYSWRWVDCNNDDGDVCSTTGLVQMLITWVGLLPAVGTLVESIRKRGHPWYWFGATALAYATWGVYVAQADQW